MIGLEEYRNVGRGERASNAETFHEICSESDDIAEWIDSGAGRDMSDDG